MTNYEEMTPEKLCEYIEADLRPFFVSVRARTRRGADPDYFLVSVRMTTSGPAEEPTHYVGWERQFKYFELNYFDRQQANELAAMILRQSFDYVCSFTRKAAATNEVEEKVKKEEKS